MMKTLNKVITEGTYLNIIKTIYDKPTANIIFKGQKFKAFPLGSRTRQECSFSPLLTNNSTKKLLDLLMNSVKFQDTKLVQINHLHFYTLTTNYQKEKLENNPIYNCIKRTKYLGINLAKEVKDVYTQMCKTLMKGTEENTNKWKDIPCSWIERILKMPPENHWS